MAPKGVKFENTFAARIQPVLNYVRHNDGTITTENTQLSLQEVTLYPLTAAFGKWFASMMELSVSSEDFFEIENAYLRYTRGDATSVAATIFNGVVVLEDGGALKAFPAAGGNVQKGAGFAAKNSKDVQLFANQILKPDGSGISAYLYSGAVDLPIPGTAATAFAPGTSFSNRFYRAALYGSWMLMPKVGVQAGYQWGQDHYYNTITNSASGTFNSSGFFGEVFAPLTPNVTPGVRYDYFRPATDVASNARSAITLYANVPLNNGLQFIGEYQHATQQRASLSNVTDDKFQVRLIWIW